MTRRVIGAVVGAVLLLALFGMAGFMAVFTTINASLTSNTSPVSCDIIGAPTAGDVKGLTSEQADNARTIIATGQRLKVPERGLIVSIATALQESGLRNISYGDRDSVGLFQQRNAWGPTADRMDPAKSATMFFTGGQQGQRGLLDITGWEQMPVWEAAQSVQVSAFPMAYDKWEPLATSTVQLVTSGQTVKCDPQPAGPTGTTCKGADTGNLRQYPNGQIPLSALCPLAADRSHRLRADAAAAFDRLTVAYKARFGGPPCITDSYRTLAEQYRLKREKPNLAAKPGTSNHGWGVALDLCGGIQNFGTPQHEWMFLNGPLYGWHHPSWAQASGSKPEPWHFEYEG